MATIAYGTAVPAAADPAGSASKSLLTRFIDALTESRMRKAEAEIRRHAHLLPAAFERAAYRLGPRNEDQLPFVR
jgi:hypothetical protein